MAPTIYQLKGDARKEMAICTPDININAAQVQSNKERSKSWRNGRVQEREGWCQIYLEHSQWSYKLLGPYQNSLCHEYFGDQSNQAVDAASCEI